MSKSYPDVIENKVRTIKRYTFIENLGEEETRYLYIGIISGLIISLFIMLIEFSKLLINNELLLLIFYIIYTTIILYIVRKLNEYLFSEE